MEQALLKINLYTVNIDIVTTIAPTRVTEYRDPSKKLEAIGTTRVIATQFPLTTANLSATIKENSDCVGTSLSQIQLHFLLVCSPNREANQ